MTIRTAIVVGGSSGLGREIVCELAEQGARVAAVGRNLASLEDLASKFESKVIPYQHDVRDFDSTPDLFKRICADLGGLDVIVYAAGVMPPVGPEEFDTRMDLDMIATNFSGGVAWLNEAAMRFKGVGAGSIVGIGSVAGDRGRAGQPVYNATKSALATYLEALRNRLSRHGVKVVTIKPGPLRTPMTAHLDQTKMMDARTAARKVIKLAARPGEHYLNPAHRVIFAIIRNIPGVIFRRLKI